MSLGILILMKLENAKTKNSQDSHIGDYSKTTATCITMGGKSRVQT